jgi:hypothetical protein
MIARKQKQARRFTDRVLALLQRREREAEAFEAPQAARRLGQLRLAAPGGRRSLECAARLGREGGGGGRRK